MIKWSHLLLVLVLVLGVAGNALAQEEIEVGDSVDGEGDGEEFVLYEIELEEGQSVEINLESDDADTYLVLLDEDEDEIASDDDGGGSLNSRLVFTPEEDGTYFIQVGQCCIDPIDGDFELSVDEIEIAQVDSTELIFGEEIEVDVDDAQSAEFTFEAEEGTVVTILSRSEADQSTDMILLNPDGDEIAASENFGDAAIVRQLLEDGGVYTVVITEAFEELLEDELEVELLETEILDLNEGSQTVILEPNYQQDYMVFEAEEDVLYVVELIFEDAVDTSLTVDMLEEDDFFADTRVTVSDVSEAAFLFEVNDDGMISVKLSTFTFDDEIEVTVTISVVE